MSMRTLTYSEETAVKAGIKSIIDKRLSHEPRKMVLKDGIIDDIVRFGYNSIVRLKEPYSSDMNKLGIKMYYNYIEKHVWKDCIKPAEEEVVSAPVASPVKPEEPVAGETYVAEVPKPVEATESTPVGVLDSFVDYVRDEVVKTLRDDIEGVRKTELVVKVADKCNTVKGVTHEVFEEVLAYVSNDEPVFLTGPAGCGKNHLVQQVCEALGLDFYFTNAVTQEFKLTGFIDAMGTYQETEFYKAFKNGGVFFLDEMDASIPEVLVILNAAIANRYFDFPNGRITAHPDFRVISAGNTVGTGADMMYVGRNQLDLASLDRFAVVRMDYDRRVEEAVSGNDKELVAFVHDVRRAVETTKTSLVVSYRAISRIAKMKQVIGIEKALKGGLVKGMDPADLVAIVGNLRINNQYTEALRNISASL